MEILEHLQQDKIGLTDPIFIEFISQDRMNNGFLGADIIDQLLTIPCTATYDEWEIEVARVWHSDSTEITIEVIFEAHDPRNSDLVMSVDEFQVGLDILIAGAADIKIPDDLYEKYKLNEALYNTYANKHPRLLIIGEACPYDTSNYFYERKGVEISPYVSAPYIALNGPTVNSKHERVDYMFTQAVTILDVLPFCVDYSPIRSKPCFELLLAWSLENHFFPHLDKLDLLTDYKVAMAPRVAARLIIPHINDSNYLNEITLSEEQNVATSAYHHPASEPFRHAWDLIF